VEERGKRGGQGREVAQTMYAHVNKLIKIKKKKEKHSEQLSGENNEN
jgi:hypothetical protein